MLNNSPLPNSILLSSYIITSSYKNYYITFINNNYSAFIFINRSFVIKYNFPRFKFLYIKKFILINNIIKSIIFKRVIAKLRIDLYKEIFTFLIYNISKKYLIILNFP